MTVLYKISFPPVNREKDCFLSVFVVSLFAGKALFRQTQAAMLLPALLHRSLERNEHGRALFEVFSPDAHRVKGGCHMTLAEVFALLAFIVSLLVLLVQVVHVTFDIAWRISHDNGNNDKKK